MSTPIPVTLSTASVYPEGVAYAFDLAHRLGYDGVEVMIWNDKVSREAGALSALSRLHSMPIMSVHAPTLLLTQRMWGSDPWTKVDKSIEMAQEVGAASVVVHPPFRWQREYGAEFAEGVAQREEASGIRIAVENMFPWRASQREMQAYIPGWDPCDFDYPSVTLDLSHCSTAGSDAMAMLDAVGERLAHVHLADGSGSFKDEHLPPGEGNQPCAEFLHALTERDYRGVVALEVGTRTCSDAEREQRLGASLAFARTHLGQS